MLKTTAIKEKQTKTQIIADIAEQTGLSKSEVKQVLEALAKQARRSLKPRSIGEFTVPELGIKLVRYKKPATKARKGRNPQTGEEITIPARPAQTVLKVRALKKAKEMIR